MNCCQCQGIESQFDERTARDKLKQYKRHGPEPTTRMLIDALRAEGLEGLTLMDIGGGVGAIQHALLEAGVLSALNVDASSAYIATAEAEAERRGLGERVTHYFGNFVELAPQIPPADVVTLDRVICCYHDLESLMRLSSERARRLYGLVYPRDTWWVKIALRLINVFFWLQRSSFRTYAHATHAVDALARSGGLSLKFHRQTFVWQVVVYARQGHFAPASHLQPLTNNL